MNPTPAKPPTPPGLVRLRRIAAALATLPRDGEVWKALEELFAEHQLDARQNAHFAGPPPVEGRDFWNGGDYCLCELGRKLSDLHSGAWKRWPDVAQAIEASGEEGE